MNLTIEVVAILLSMIAFIVTLIGFFASLKFYQDGIKLQNSATEVLTNISSKADSIQNQVSGMFDKTLDAALAKKEEISEEFESIQQRIQDSANEILKKVSKEIDGLSKEKVDEISKSIKSEFDEISDQLKVARESLDTASSNAIIPPILERSAVARNILSELNKNYQMPEKEILALRLGKEKMTRNRLEQLLNSELIALNTNEKERVYSITKKGAEVSAILSQLYKK